MQKLMLKFCELQLNWKTDSDDIIGAGVQIFLLVMFGATG